MRARGDDAGTVIERLLGFRPRGPRAPAVAARVTGQVVVVTGASRGIGAEVARRLARVGARLVLIARDVDALRPAHSRCAIRSLGTVSHRSQASS